MHVLEAGQPGRPAVLLLHGFPELAYSWRKIMPALADAGFHVVAPDQRGYGGTTGWDPRYEGDLASFRMLNLVEDAVQLLKRLEIGKAHVVGHDFGASVAAHAGMMRPELFRSVTLMSAPFGGAPIGVRPEGVHRALAAIGRKHYQWYYSTPEANEDMRRCAQGVRAFLLAYYHYKSADWKDNKPHRLEGWTAAELAKMPTYYIMELDKDMAETVAPHLPARAPAWLTEEELTVYADAFERTGFQGGLQWYRCTTSAKYAAELSAAIGDRTVDQPSMFIAGAADWGIYQKPGDFERMQGAACTDMRACHLVQGAGHWVQQEQPRRTAELLIDFLTRSGVRGAA